MCNTGQIWKSENKNPQTEKSKNLNYLNTDHLQPPHPYSINFCKPDHFLTAPSFVINSINYYTPANIYTHNFYYPLGEFISYSGSNLIKL